MRKVNFIKAYELYEAGLFIQNPRSKRIFSLKTKRIDAWNQNFPAEDFLIDWDVLEENSSIIEVNVYKVLYSYNNEVELTEDYFRNESEWSDRYCVDDAELFPQFIKLVEESKKIRQEIIAPSA